MMSYLVTREGQELGTFKISKIEKGLQTGFFRLSDLGWHEASGWQGLFEIVGSAKALASPSGAALMMSAGIPLEDAPAGTMPDSCSGVPPVVMRELAGTRPWVRLISSMMGVGCALLTAACFVLAVEGAHASGASLFKKAPHPLVQAAVCALSTFMILYPALKLSQYASLIARLAQSRSSSDLAAALMEQRRFWKFHGILLVVSVALLFLLMMTCAGIASQWLS